MILEEREKALLLHLDEKCRNSGPYTYCDIESIAETLHWPIRETEIIAFRLGQLSFVEISAEGGRYASFIDFTMQGRMAARELRASAAVRTEGEVPTKKSDGRANISKRIFSILDVIVGTLKLILRFSP